MKEHAQLRNPELQSRTIATQFSAAEGVDVAISAWLAGGRNRELTEEQEKLHADLAREA